MLPKKVCTRVSRGWPSFLQKFCCAHMCSELQSTIKSNGQTKEHRASSYSHCLPLVAKILQNLIGKEKNIIKNLYEKDCGETCLKNLQQ